VTEPARPAKSATELVETVFGLFDLLDSARVALEPLAAVDRPTREAARDGTISWPIPERQARRANIVYHRLCRILEVEPATDAADDALAEGGG
jgi:hypothetical protein